MVILDIIALNTLRADGALYFMCYSASSVVNGTVTKKGTTQYSNVTSTSYSKYPSNGESGSYWYVYKGAY